MLGLCGDGVRKCGWAIHAHELEVVKIFYNLVNKGAHGLAHACG